MTIQAVIIWLVVGAIAGWLAGRVMRGGGFGLLGDVIVGIFGGIIGGLLFWFLGLPPIGGGLISAILEAFIGACVLLFVLRLVMR